MEIVGQIESKIKAKVKDAKIEVKDIVGDNDHFKLIVSSKSFAGLPILKQHQMVFDCLRDDTGLDIIVHSISLETIVL